jgi:hypothetical protein
MRRELTGNGLSISRGNPIVTSAAIPSQTGLPYL